MASNHLIMSFVSKGWQGMTWSCFLSKWIVNRPVIKKKSVFESKEVMSKSNRISLLLTGKQDKNYLYIDLYVSLSNVFACHNTEQKHNLQISLARCSQGMVAFQHPFVGYVFSIIINLIKVRSLLYLFLFYFLWWYTNM